LGSSERAATGWSGLLDWVPPLYVLQAACAIGIGVFGLFQRTAPWTVVGIALCLLGLAYAGLVTWVIKFYAPYHDGIPRQ